MRSYLLILLGCRQKRHVAQAPDGGVPRSHRRNAADPADARRPGAFSARGAFSYEQGVADPIADPALPRSDCKKPGKARGLPGGAFGKRLQEPHFEKSGWHSVRRKIVARLHRPGGAPCSPFAFAASSSWDWTPASASADPQRPPKAGFSADRLRAEAIRKTLDEAGKSQARLVSARHLSRGLAGPARVRSGTPGSVEDGQPRSLLADAAGFRAKR